MYAYGKVFQFQQMSSVQLQQSQSHKSHPQQSHPQQSYPPPESHHTIQSLDRANDGVH